MKNFLLYVLIFILFLLVGFLYWDKYLLIRNKITSLTKNVSNTSNKNRVTPSTAPGYSVSIAKAPYINDGFNFEVNVKNISITPFIIGIFFKQCKFTDNKGNEYAGSFENMPDINGGGGIVFSKALLSGENKTVKFNRITLSIVGAENIDLSGTRFQTCRYDNNGNNICTPIDGIKIKECTVVTSTVPTNIDHPNKFPLVVNFP